ncbi:DUF4363 family protein [Clostridium sp. BJN0001]|uniref:DUF4363 family protein n=1 Tax=Clostridium sp. BJN0001 TaxID=2930219 RepID=UPI001FD5853B|nr:DUF4363 family protein [Clostridium sp. BJN0001]
MKNAIISVVIFWLMFFSVLYFSKSMVSFCNVVEIKSEEIESTLSDQDMKKAYNQTLELIDIINDKKFLASIYLNHIDYDAISNEAVKLSVYVKCNDRSESTASLHFIKQNIDNIKNLQIPTLKNIL